MSTRGVLHRTRTGSLLVVPVAVFGLMLASLTLSSQTDGDDRTPTAAGSLVPAEATEPCTDVLLLVARGSGERADAGRPGGPTLQRLVDQFVARGGQHDRSLATETVALKAPGPRKLKRDGARSTTPADRATGPALVRAWAGGVTGAATAVRDRLVAAAASCPDQQVALAGYSQGAMVMHRALLGLEDRPDITGRVVGLGLVADGDRNADSTRVWGGPAANGGQGVAVRHLGGVPGVPAAGSTVAVWNVCNAGDLVCDHRGNRFRDAKAAHRGYTDGRAAKKVGRAGAALGNRSARWALPAAAPEQVAAQVGMRVQHQLGVRVRQADRDSVRWDDVQGLPAGLTLGDTGLLAGVATEEGVHDVTFTVRNSRSAAFAHRAVGHLRVTISAEAAAAVTTGGTQTCSLRDDGSVQCWGRNNWGQFGNGSTAGTRAPAAAATTAGDWRELSTSGSATCGIRENGSLWCWGLNQYGQLGDGTRTNRKSPARVGTSTKWTDVSVGWAHTCAVRQNGTAWCWGYNKVGQLGDDTTKVRTKPRKVVGDVGRWSSVVAGGFFSCGTTRDGKAWCWGANAFGQLGNGTRAGSRTPTAVGFTSDWAEVDASWYSACGLKTTGELRCWGLNEQGQLGDGTRVNRVHPALAGGGAAYRDFSVGEAHVCGIGTDYALRCWGDNTYGQLGAGAPALARQPVTPVQGDGWYSVAAGWLHTCGVRQDGTTWCWGNNEYGQVGDGTATDRSSAVPVS